MRIIYKIFLLFILFTSLFAFKNQSIRTANFSVPVNIPPFDNYHSKWAQSWEARLSLREKIGQMMMLSAYPMHSEAEWKQLGDIIEKNYIGGIIVFKGTPYRTAKMINYLQSRAKLPLMVAVDGEWGLAMRMDSVVEFPHQMQLGAIENNALIYEFGEAVAKQCKRLGIQINFAPDVDINNNPKNPVINSRSFGELRENVAEKGFAYMKALQKNRILAVAKHFPGHGDTESDSHKSLPLISASKKRLDSLELYPFKFLIKNNVGGIMSAHLYVPALDSTLHQSASLSPLIINGLLKKQLGFNGLIFTDALGMQGVAKYHRAGEIEQKAVLAGNDVLLMPQNVELAIDSVCSAVKNKTISRKNINKSVSKILNTKFWFGLNHYKPIKLTDITKDLNTEDVRLVRRRLIEASLTVLRDTNEILPFQNLSKLKIASIEISGDLRRVFSHRLQDYASVSSFYVSKYEINKGIAAIQSKLKDFDYLIVSISSTNQYSKDYGIPKPLWAALNKLAQKHKLIFVDFANAYSLAKIKKPANFAAIIEAYNDDDLTQDYAAQLIFGGIKAGGRLPVSAGKFKAGEGKHTKQTRLKYSIPSEVNISENDLQAIDSIVLDAIKKKATPGCQILGIRNGVVFYDKSFGWHTYSQRSKVKPNDIYDLASLTKVIATLPSLMYLYDRKLFAVNAKLKAYLPETDTTNKCNLSIKSILAHQARLQGWIPFYLSTYDTNSLALRQDLYRFKKETGYSTQVANKLYILDTYKDSIFQRILSSKLRRRTRYKYSDLGFYMFKRLIEEQTQVPLNEFVDSVFYNPLGACRLGYLPLQKFAKDDIIPTEDDKKFRKQLLQGYVHDYGAALIGGVGGHAGLFSNANDLAKMAEMYLNGGTYGAKRYLKASTIAYFTQRPFRHNRRALGFDRLPLKGHRSVAGSLASAKSYGHSGFTGTLVWIDPKYNFIFIFLSNRINPDIENKKLLYMNVRSKIHNEFYKAMKK